ncbi:DNA-3-methyladenine glycosylase II [Aquipluma nitroreducens]|uniref:Putative 3-methyladenine DNA glycosylase n=1 Tax=Aquipluma nitroreducens TaxID=2010828 RepID=A0A5K7S8N4_9BACT|nr:DNA-3-methyladenine glycosylase [Aquipluma nitroreducens]BBE17900.1 DNA-3-methyladenine glycosylase II [Aquipluma nitroreducens]
MSEYKSMNVRSFSPPSEGSGEANRLSPDFFLHDVLEVAPALIGKLLVRQFDDGRIERYRIVETEAYRGTEDLACHASKGRTPRTEVMFQEGGKVYVYLIYGMYWLLNLVTGEEGNASAVLIRGIEGFSGPGRLGRELQLDKSFYGENLSTSSRIWVEDAEPVHEIKTSKRIGIGYSGEVWVNKLWRFYV